MQNKNQISFTRKALYGVMLLGLFFSAFGIGNLPSARAQEAATDTPTPEVQVQETATPEPEVQETITPTPEVQVQETATPTPDVEAQIVGGGLADPGEYPWQVALVGGNATGDFYNDPDTWQFCGGTLIAPQWVLTAAHCITEDNGSVSLASSLDVVAGIYNLETPTAGYQQRDVIQIIRHAAYNRSTYNNDIALLKLASPITIGGSGATKTDIIPLVPAGIGNLAGTNSMVTGWGNTDPSGEAYPTQLYEVQLPIISNSVCNNATHYNGKITANMLCAGYDAGGYDSCQGDSGGPMIVSNAEQWNLAGVVSWGVGCAQPNKPGVYTRVSQYVDWINPYIATYTISGNAGVAGTTLTYTGGSTTADGSGLYSFTVSTGWSGTVTPSLAGYIFSPVNRSYTNVLANETDQNYTAALPFTTCAAVTQIPQTECDALVTFYNSTNGANWYHKTGWLQTDAPCNWQGVYCYSGHVTELAPGANNLSGSIPPELGNLPNLMTLRLGWNSSLSGPIPTELGDLTNLSVLSLGYNNLTGPIPTELGNLTNLSDLYLSGNQLSGSIPTELGSLTNLRWLYLDDNQLSGSIPAELGNLTQVTSLGLENNQLSGEFPISITNFVNLDYFTFDPCELTSTNPSVITFLNHLQSGWNVCPPPSIPALLLPANNALATDYMPTLDWRDSTLLAGRDFDRYQLQVATDAAFTPPTTLDEDIPGISNSTYTFSSDLSPNTKFYWRVRAFNAYASNNVSAWSLVRTFRTKLETPELSLPANSASPALNNKRPAFDWVAVDGATTYTLQILKENPKTGFFTVVAHTGTIKTPAHTYTPTVDLLPNTTYQWKVKANGTNSGNYSMPFTFTTSENPPKIPALSAPANNALVDSTLGQTLKWNPVLPAIGYPAAASYEVEYAANSAFDTPVAATVAVTEQPITIGALLPNRTYYWHVRSWSAAGNHSAWSAARIFRTMLSTPVLNLPSDGTTEDNKRPTFSWDEVPGATTYTLQILKQNPKTLLFTVVANTGTIKAPAYTYIPKVDLLPSTTYQWKVKANGANTGVYSAPLTFTTSGNPPKIPILSAPASNALVDSAVAQTLDWNPVLGITTASPATTYPDAASFEVEYAMNSSFTGVSDILVTVNDNTVLGTHTAPISLSPGRTYYWRVRSWSGENATGNHSAWSAVRTIRVKFVAPVLDSVTVTDGSPTFTWHSDNGLWTNYTLLVINSATNKVVKSITVPAPTTTYTMPAALLPTGAYRWQVKINGLYTPISSAIGTFTK